MTDLCAIFKAISSHDLAFLEANAEAIRKAYEGGEEYFSTCVCGCEESTTIGSYLSGQINVWDNDDNKVDEEQLRYVNTVKFLIEKDIINPNFIFPCGILFTNLTGICGWEYEFMRADIAFKNTSDDVLKNFRDKNGSSVAHHIFYSLVMHPGMKKWIEYLDKIGFDWHCRTNEGQSLMSLAFDSMDVYYIEFFLTKGLNVNEKWDEYRHYCNGLQWILYNFRYERNSKHLQNMYDVVKILVDAGIDLKAEDKNGRNTEDYINKYGWYKTPVKEICTLN